MIIQKGNPLSNPITFTFKSTGLPYNLTDRKVLFTLKKLDDTANNDDSALITKDIEVHTAPTLGKSTLELSCTDTDIPCGRYKADFRIYAEGCVQMNTNTFLVDVINIVTKRP